MARIHHQNFVEALVPVLADAALPLDRELFDEALKNPEAQGGKAHGIVMTYEHEALFCIRKAYQGLQEQVAPEIFSARIAEAVQTFSAPFPEPGHNLTYAHFLFHGIQQPTLDGIAAKIVDNGRIIHESTELQRALREKFGKSRPTTLSGYNLFLEHGDTDDFHGLSLRICAANQNSFFDRTAKTGFLIDRTNATAVIINVQGRKILKQTATPEHSAQQVESIARENKRNAESGREFARLTQQLGKDPRTYAIEEAKVFLTECGVREIKAIKPHEHVMHIAGHRRFSDRYEPMIRAAGLTRDEGPYLCNAAPLSPSYAATLISG